MSSILSKIKTAIREPGKVVLYCTRFRIFRLIPDRAYLKMTYRLSMKKKLNLENPTTFNEKLQWLKLYDRKPIYTTMVDKVAAKEYVAKQIGEEYIIPTLGVWDSFDEIDFDKLPDQFVLKCSHDSGGLVIVRDKSKLDLKAARKKINKCLKRDYFYQWREWPYKNVPKKILAEAYMEDEKTSELRDYKFFCFDGTGKCYKIDFDRFVDHRANYYTPDHKLLHFGEAAYPPDFESSIEPPKLLNQMIDLAESLSEGIPFLRVDFYEVNEKIYFGEMTFFPGAGVGKFVPEEWDKKIGDWLVLPRD